MFYSIFKHQKMTKLNEHCSEVRYEHSDFLVVFTVPPVAFWQVLECFVFTFKSEIAAFCSVYFKLNKKMSAAFGIWKLRRFILKIIFSKHAFLCVFFSVYWVFRVCIVAVHSWWSTGECGEESRVKLQNPNLSPRMISCTVMVSGSLNSPLKLTYLKALLLKCQSQEFPWESLSPHHDLAQTPLAFTTV